MSNLTKRFVCVFNYFSRNNVKILEAVRPCLYNETSQIRSYGSCWWIGNAMPLKTQNSVMITTRLKSKKAKSRVQDDEDSDADENEDDDDDDVHIKGVEVKTITLDSLRIDMILKKALGSNRKKIEKMFYENSLRLNGRIIPKKSSSASEGDEIDMVKGFANKNPNFLIVGRVEVIKVVVDKEEQCFVVKVKCSKSLLIDNYPDGDEWKQIESTEA